jgi:hypothetical protein
VLGQSTESRVGYLGNDGQSTESRVGCLIGVEMTPRGVYGGPGCFQMILEGLPCHPYVLDDPFYVLDDPQ